MNPEFNPEEISSIDKVVARNPEEKKEIEEYFAKSFSEQKWMDLEGKELEKTEEQVKIIDLVNEETNKLSEKYGREKFDVKSRNVHLLKKEDFDDVFGEKIEKAVSFFAPKGQFAAFSLRENITSALLAKKIFHEYIHFKSFQQAYVKDANTIVMGQTGLYLSPKLKEERKESYFFNLNEAVTEELTKRFCNNIIKKHPDFDEETKLIGEYVENKIKEGKKIDETNIISARKDKEKISAGKLGYERQRKVLNTLVDKLYERNKNQFSDREEVFDLFAKSVFTGDVVGEKSWGRLVDKTFGNGTLQQLAEKDSDLKELKSLVGKL